jgi:hypothetical protein
LPLGPSFPREPHHYPDAVTVDEILAELAAGNFEALVGVAEDESLEFKRQPYRLDDDQQAFELAKDVSSLANASAGGLLVVGFETQRTEGSSVDSVARVRAFARDLIDEARYLNKIRQLIFPLVVGVRVEFKPENGNADRGVLAVVVPPQPEDQKYFLVAKSFTGPDGSPGWLVGVSIRSFDRDRPLAIGEIHSLLSRGRNIAGQLDAMQATLAQIDARGSGAVEAPAAAPTDSVLNRVREGLDDLAEAEGEQ